MGQACVASAFHVYMLLPRPRCSAWASPSLISPNRVSLPRKVIGSACTSTFSRLARHSRALRPAHAQLPPIRGTLTEGFSHLVTSMTAPVASGWSVRRVGVAPIGKVPPYHGAHPIKARSSERAYEREERIADTSTQRPLSAQWLAHRQPGSGSSEPSGHTQADVHGSAS